MPVWLRRWTCPEILQLLQLLVFEFGNLGSDGFDFLFLVGQVALALLHTFQLAVQGLDFLVQAVFLSL